MFEIVKLTYVCQYWRSTLISCPHLWSSIFVKNDHQDFVAACLERSREVTLTVRLDLKYGISHDYLDCTCTRDGRRSGMRINKSNPCRYHATIHPLVNIDHIQRIRKLDVHLALLDNVTDDGLDLHFGDALREFKFFAFPLLILESLSFRVHHWLDPDTHIEFPSELFSWRSSPSTELRHLALRNCYGGPIQAVCNLTSLELYGDLVYCPPMDLDQRIFLPLISNSPSLVSLRLSHCCFPDRGRLLRITPVKLPELKSLWLMDIYRLSGFSGLIEILALKTLSAFWILPQDKKSRLVGFRDVAHFLVRAESDNGF